MAFVHSQPSAAVGLHRKPLWRRIKEGPVFFLVPLFAMLLLFYLCRCWTSFGLSFTNSKIGSAEYTYTLDSYVQVLTDHSFVPCWVSPLCLWCSAWCSKPGWGSVLRCWSVQPSAATPGVHCLCARWR